MHIKGNPITDSHIFAVFG
uniref:Uncharacterized protein n=1 Tax=Anguilla anguilla TaxID=7936 RepID=A0A0E9R2I7_ANGAN